jgi:predicted nucleotidyltransferase
MSEKVRAEFDRYVSYISTLDGVLFIYLFGSYAYGEPTEKSDIDILVVVKDGIDTLKIMQKISRGLCDRQVAMDLIAVNAGDFKELTESTRVTLQREVKDKGVLVYGYSGLS